MLTKSQYERWIKALRSGDYPQTQGCMQDDKGFCCLGVLMHIEGEDIFFGEEDDDYNNYNLVYSWVDFPDITVKCPAHPVNSGEMNQMPLSTKLVDMNDSGHSFEEIADTIVEAYERRGFADD